MKRSNRSERKQERKERALVRQARYDALTPAAKYQHAVATGGINSREATRLFDGRLDGRNTR